MEMEDPKKKVYIKGILLDYPPEFIDPYGVLEGLESFSIYPLNFEVNRENYGDPFSWYDSNGTTDWKPDILEAKEKGWKIWIISSTDNTWDHGLVFEKQKQSPFLSETLLYLWAEYYMNVMKNGIYD